jgi:hypothetical protein
MNELARIEATTDIAPITDQVHSLLLDSVAKISDQWIEQLKIVRENTLTLETQILACVTKTKSDITMLHDLGVKVADEARRGQEVCRQLSDSVEKIATP